MEVTALIWIVLLLLVAQADFGFSERVGFPHVVPDRQQIFSYESITVSCEGLEGLTGWRVMRKVQGSVTTCSPSWSTSTGPCEIRNAFKTDSGEYWCELGGGKKTNSVNITVTGGSVILVVPAHPVVEGDAVTLHCRVRQTSSNLSVSALFFKDGRQMENSLTGNLTIHSVSRSNEGLYRCKVPDVGESEESWLAVRAVHEEAQTFSHQALLSLGLSGLCVLVLLVLGLLRYWKHHAAIRARASTSPSCIQSSSSPQTASAETQLTYAVVTNPRKKRGSPPVNNESPAIYSTIIMGER